MDHFAKSQNLLLIRFFGMAKYIRYIYYIKTNNMTSIDFLLSHMWTTDWVNYSKEEKKAVIEQAKEMYNKEIDDAKLEGYGNGYTEGTYDADNK